MLRFRQGTIEYRDGQRMRCGLVFFLAWLILVTGGCLVTVGIAGSSEVLTRVGSIARYPENKDQLTTKQCMQCHPRVASKLRTAGAKHGYLPCRQCHQTFHTYRPGKNSYSESLPKCTRCHEHPHGEELIQCTGCHQDAHAPLAIPADRILSLGCYVCHPDEDREIKTFSTRHTELYCTACHHTKHGNIPDCLECHQPHTGAMMSWGRIIKPEGQLDECVSCHSPHKVLNVSYSDTTENSVCVWCHRIAGDMLGKSNTKHSAFPCIKCHPSQHKTIKRCIDCHGRPHPEAMMQNKPAFSSCGGCHGVAHSIIR